MEINTNAGRKVKYLNEHGYPSDRESANKVLKTGEVYTVADLDVGRFRSMVYLIGIKGSFNSVMFEDV